VEDASLISFRDRNTRGRTQTGWLDSQHSFSFGGYHDPRHMGFRSLRVLNEDRIIPGAGFPAHSHRDVEIVTYVLQGRLKHGDGLGHGSVVEPGEVQRISAGSGITHSEYNASGDAPLHLLQLWIIPDRTGTLPAYAKAPLSAGERASGLILAAGPEGSGAAVAIAQDARIYAATLDAGVMVAHPLAASRGAWLQVARGLVALNDTEMREGDGAAIEGDTRIAIEALTDSEILLFDLA
jgi:redox-sensitive bicupin YhaK (pirin superfamily)